MNKRSIKFLSLFLSLVMLMSLALPCTAALAEEEVFEEPILELAPAAPAPVPVEPAPVVEPTVELTVEPSAEPTAEQTTVEPTAEPIAEQTTVEPTAEPVCDCRAGEGAPHAETCPCYVPSGDTTGEASEDPSADTTEDPVCSCGAVDGKHAETCPCYKAEESAEEPKKDIPEGYVLKELHAVTGDNVSINVYGIMPADAALKVEPFSEENAAYTRAAIGTPEGENSFFYAYDIKLVSGEGANAAEYTPQELGVKLNVFFIDPGVRFGDDTMVCSVSVLPPVFQPDNPEADTEPTIVFQALEGVLNMADSLMFDAVVPGGFAFCGTKLLPAPEKAPSTTLRNGTVAVSGVLPEGTKLVVTPMDDPFAASVQPVLRAPKMMAKSAMAMQSLEAPEGESEPSSEKRTYTYDVKLSLDGQEIQPDGTVRVTFGGIEVFENGYVEIYHILDSADAILAGKGMEISDPEFVAAFPREAAIAAQATGKSGVVFVEYFSTDNGTVSYDENGFVCVNTTSFSTYYLVSGRTANGKEDSNVVYINDDENNTYYVTPGTTIRFVRCRGGNSQASEAWAKYTTAQGGIYGKFNTGYAISTEWHQNSSPYLHITVPLTAPADSKYVLVTSRGVFDHYDSRNSTTTIIVMSQDDVIDNIINNTQYPVVLAILQDGGDLPGEPGISNKTYLYATDRAYTISDGGSFASAGTGIIDSNISANPWFETSDDGTNTMGIVDRIGNGEQTKAAVSGVDWNLFLDKIAAYNQGKSYANQIKATNDVVITPSNKANYQVVPYVVKLQTSFSLGWHIDCCVKPKAAITISYDANLFDGISVDNITVPDTKSDIPPVSMAIGDIKQADSVIPVGSSVTGRAGDSTYNLTFKGWNTKSDGTGTTYTPGQTTSFSTNTLLYALWDSDISSGTLKLSKTVVQGANAQTPPDQSFTFTLTFHTGNGARPYKVYNAQNQLVTSGNISSGGTLSLKHGQWAQITGVHVGTYSITEAAVTDFTQSSTGASGNIRGGATSIAEFINTYTKPATATYTVTHMIEKVDGTYEQHSVESLSGIIGQNTAAAAKSIADYNAQLPVTQKPISADDSDNITIYYKRATYDVSYAYTGTVPANAPAVPATASYKWGATVNLAAKPTLAGYTFNGWNTTAVTPANNQFTMPKNNVPFDGSWTENQVTINYVAQTGGSVSRASETLGASTGTAQGSNAAAANGYTFVGWYNNEACTGTALSTNAAFIPTKVNGLNVAAIYYAKFSKDQYTITYVDDKVTPPAPVSYSVSYSVTDSVSIAAAPAKDGYKFNGWKVTSAAGSWPLDTIYNGGNSIDAGAYGNVTLTAQWSDQYKYALNFDENIGSSSIVHAVNMPDNQSVDTWQDNTPQTFNWTKVPYRTGYEFKGWAKTADGAVLSGGAGLNTYTIPGTPATIVTHTLYAQWEIIKYIITYDGNGGILPDGQEAKVNYTVETTGTLSAAPSRPGYEFKGWKLETAVNNWVADTYEAAAAYGPNKYGDITLVAQWEEKTVEYIYTPVCRQSGATDFGTVKLNDTDATASSDAINETVGAVTGGPNADPGAIAEAKAPAFRFVGWFDNENCEGAPIANEGAPIANEGEFKPAKDSETGLYEGGKYYALFEYNLTSMVITKAWSDGAADISAVFTVAIDNTPAMQVVVPAGSIFVTIDDVVVGSSVTVTEVNTNWRYTPSGGVTKKIVFYDRGSTASNPNTFSFNNALCNSKWLNDNDTAVNTGSTN